MKMFLLGNIARMAAPRGKCFTAYTCCLIASVTWRKNRVFSPIFFSPDCRLERVWVNQMRIRRKKNFGGILPQIWDLKRLRAKGDLDVGSILRRVI